jgi:hypothetical protein
MNRWIAVAGLVASCHGGSAPPTVPAEVAKTPIDAAPAPHAIVDLGPDAACARFDALAGGGCAWTLRFPPAMRDAKTCVGSLTQWLSPDTADRDKLQHIVSCWALECEAAADCMVNLQASSAPPPPRHCGDEGIAPIVVDPRGPHAAVSRRRSSPTHARPSTRRSKSAASKASSTG